MVIRLQGVLGIKVRIMKEWDPTGKVGPRTPLPDVVTVLAPKVRWAAGHAHSIINRRHLWAPAGLPLPITRLWRSSCACSSLWCLSF